MGLFRILSWRTTEREKAAFKEDRIYPNFLRDVMLDRRFSRIEQCGVLSSEDPELTEECNESF